MYKRIFFLIGIFLSVGVLLGYGREVLAIAPLPDVQKPIVGKSDQEISEVREMTAMVLLTETVKLLSPNQAVGSFYGRSVLIQGDTLFVGETRSGSGNVPGKVYIYERHVGGPNNWGLTKVITAFDSTTRDGFGTALAIDGNTLLVGALVGNGNASQSGTAYIFERDAGGSNNWGQIAKLQALDGAFEDRFGWTVDIGGDTAVIGARWDDNSAGSNAGAIYIYERNAGGMNIWGQVKKVMASDAAAGDYFGTSVAIFEDTLVVGAPLNNDFGSDSGAVYVLERNQGGTGNWGEVTKLGSTVVTAFDEFGRWVAIEGDLIVSGAHQPTGDGPGYAIIHSRDQGGPNNWGEVAQLLAAGGANGDEFGVLVGLEGGRVYVGARFGDGLTTNTGAGYIFEPDINNPDNWVETFKLVASDGAVNDEFGYDLSVSEDIFVVGGFGNDDFCPSNPNCDSGSAYLFYPDLLTDVTIEKTVSDITAVPGQPLTYTLTFTNNGPDIAFGTVITDFIPETIVNPTFTSSGGIITPTGSVPFVWQVANLAYGAGGVITVTGIISPELVSETTIVNTAVISNSQDITPTNNSSTAVTQVIIPQVSLIAADYVVDEDGGQVMVTAVLSPAQPYLDVSVGYETADGTALAGEDYTAVSGILTFTAGTTEAQILVPILDDQLVEPDEAFSLELSYPAHATLGSIVNAAITILDDDAYPELNLSAPDYTVLESDGQAQLTVNLSHPYPESVSVAYQTTDGTAVNGEDYTAVSGILTFTAGTTEAQIFVPILNDQLVEESETFTVTLSDPVHATLGSLTEATVLIMDDDSFPSVSLSSEQSVVTEDAGEAILTVTLSHGYPEPVSMTYQTTDGTAVAGSDYTGSSGTLTFTPGITQTTFTVPITDDLLIEADETFSVSLTNFTNAAPGSPISAAVTILDNDEEVPPPVTSSLYLPLIVRPAAAPPQPAFPIFVSSGVAPRPMISQGEVFFTATILIPADLPPTGQFFLSADPDQLTAVSVDDELAFVLNGQELFVKRFSTDGQTIYPEIVPLPRQTMIMIAGQTVRVVFRDVFSDQVSATSLWIVHIP